MRIYNYEIFAGGREGGVSSLTNRDEGTITDSLASIRMGEKFDCCTTSEAIVPISQPLAQLL